MSNSRGAMSSINGDDPSAVVPEVTNPAFVTSPNSAAASGPRGPVPRQMTTAQTLSKLSETGGIDNMPGVVMRTLHRKAKLETVLHRQYSAIDAAEKKKEEAPATVQDRLTDYLLYNAALDVEHKWNSAENAPHRPPPATRRPNLSGHARPYPAPAALHTTPPVALRLPPDFEHTGLFLAWLEDDIYPPPPSPTDVYTEGFAGNDGCDRNYWLQAVEDEDEDNGDENSKMKQKVQPD